MQTENDILIDAPIERIYDLAARVERWPEILPHYRWVTVLRDEGSRRLVEMAASRSGFPVRWVSIQELAPAENVIRFRHVRGITRGMDVRWILLPAPPGGVHVRIVHDFDPPWPAPLGPLAARYVVGDLFVHAIAGKTLRRIKALAEGDAGTDAGVPLNGTGA